MEPDRRTVLTAATALAGLSGCVSRFLPPKAKVVVDSGGSVQTQYVHGQPTFEDAPAADGWLATRPEGMNDILRWQQLFDPVRESMRQAQDRFEQGTHFFTAIIGALPWGYQLTDYKDAQLSGGKIRVYTKPVDTYQDTPGPSVPDHTYDYTFLLWKLRDDIDPPTDIEVNFRPHTATSSG